MKKKRMNVVLTAVTSILAVAVCLHLQCVFLPGWLPWIGGVVGVTWWVCRYMHWQAWEARKQQIRKTGR